MALTSRSMSIAARPPRETGGDDGSEEGDNDSSDEGDDDGSDDGGDGASGVWRT